MAEDLTEYFHENGIRVRYLHSDIDTLGKNRNYERPKTWSVRRLSWYKSFKRGS